MTAVERVAGGAEPAGAPRRGSGVRSILTAGVGVLMLGAAAVVLWNHRGDFGRAVDSVRGAPALLVLSAVALPVFNWMFTTAAFWLLTRRFGAVSVAEMAALMGASWLANYLPLKPGLAGRVAYHRAVHGIPIAASSVVILQALVTGVVSTVLLIGVTAVVAGGVLGAVGVWALGMVQAGLLVFAALHGRALGRGDGPAGRPAAWVTVGAVLGVRTADAAVWVVRYWVAFEVVGSPVTMVQASALAAVGQAVACLPVIGGALGVREWAVAGLSSALPSAGSAGRVVSAGLVAELFNRVVEVVLAVVVGVGSWAYLARKHGRGRGGPGGAAPGGGAV